ncbi:MAG: metallophosphoesterase [Bacteroidetes bacterium]|nr:MAG: metallophosphoesterase [Bacteroidota bacterium]TAG95200.1 MAG: metallophosphoesterase [Bacteroidota bacterium]
MSFPSVSSLIVAFLMLFLDIIIFYIVKIVYKKKYIQIALIVHSAIFIVSFVAFRNKWIVFGDTFKTILGTLLITLYFCKPFIIFSYFVGSIMEFTQKIIRKIIKKPTFTPEQTNSRREFLAKTAIFTGALPFGIMTYGMSMGAYDYRVINQKLKIPNLPKKFNGMKIAQISDLHVGSFWDNIAPKRGIELLLQQKPDVIFVTGDLVNSETSEVKPHLKWLGQIKAELGVFSILGNHDYGDYKSWNSEDEKRQNLLDLYSVQKNLGWNLLVDNTRYITIENEKIAIMGVGNWGSKSYFPKYGRLLETYEITDKDAVKLLLTHDPTHFESQVIDYQDIAVSFSGHTHGMQVGLDFANFKWSPAQYIYNQWAGLYQKGTQQIYVNRGFGFSNVFPARLGILPEITIFQLES